MTTGRKADIGKLWLIIALMTILAGATLAATALNSTNTHAVLSATHTDNSITAYLYAEGLGNESIVITLTDEAGGYYILPATKTSTTSWEATFPITPAQATLTALIDGEELARVTASAPAAPSRTPPTMPVQETPPQQPTIEQSTAILHVRDQQRQLPAATERLGPGRIKVTPQGLPIKDITFNAINEQGLQTKALRLSQPAKEKTLALPAEKTVQTYAIDPTQLQFTNATVTVKAKGTKLYKCALWDFDTETCNGSWQLLRTLTPGEDYALTLTPDDPAYAETTYFAMEWGVITNLNDTWQTINLTYAYIEPVIIVTPHYTSAGVPTVTRVTNVTASSFATRLQAAQSASSTTRNAYYLVVEAGNWTLPGGRKLEAYTFDSTNTDRKSDWTPDTQTYTNSYTNPVVLAQVMSYNDTQWSTAWTSATASGDPPSSTVLRVGKHVGEDTSTTRAEEVIGYVVVEQGHGNLTGNDYDTLLSGVTVQGIGNSPPYSITYTQAFSSTPAVLLTTIAGMNGGDGGWSVAYGTQTASQARLACDEDEIGDIDRSHAAEQVAILAFQTAGSYLLNNEPVISNETFSHAIADPETPVVLNVTVTDADGPTTVQYVTATLVYPNTTAVNLTLNQVAIGSDITSSDQESGTAQATALDRQVIGETGVVSTVNGWTHITTQHVYTDPVVFAFTRNQSDISGWVEQALAIITNITTTSFELAVVAPDNTFATDNVGYVVIEKGVHNLLGAIVQAGEWSYSGTAFVARSYEQAFAATPTVFIQLQDQTTTHWYTGRYTASTLSASSISIQYEDASNAFAGSATVGYLAFEQGTANSLFEGDVEASISEDPPSAWHALSFTNSHTQPVFMGILSEVGGDPTKLGTGSLSATGLNVRTTEETYSDAEQNHATNDALWMAFNGSATLYDDASAADNEDERIIAEYQNVLSDAINLLSEVTIELNITEYNASGSQANQNADPRLRVSLMTDSGYESIGEKALLGAGTLSWTTYDSDVLADWLTPANRDVLVEATHLDYNNTTQKDSIAWNSVTVTLSGGNATTTWRVQISDTQEMGVYNITNIYASDGLSNVSNSYTTLFFTIADITPPTFTYIANQTFSTTEPVSVTFKAYDYSGIDDWAVNDTSFAINSTGHLTNATTLAEGLYNINITVNDTYGNTAWKPIVINITSIPDTTPPQFVPPLSNLTIAYGAALSYDINATDDRGRLDTFSVNDSRFAITPDQGVLTNATLLDVGDYTLGISVNDTAGNQNASTLALFVTDQESPVITITNQTVEYGEAFGYQVNATDDVAIDTYWLSGTTALAINQSGYITNTTKLIRNNIYPMYVHVNDTAGHETAVYFEVTVIDVKPPGPVTNLTLDSTGKSWIAWSWTNPPASDFENAIIHLDGAFYQNTSDEAINITGLQPATQHIISIQTADDVGNVNTQWVNDTQQTLPNALPTLDYTPANNTATTLDQPQLYTTPHDTDDAVLCVRIIAAGDGKQGLLYKNCTALNDTQGTYNWTAMPLTTLAKTQVLWHFDNESSEGENDTLIKDFAGLDNNRTCTAGCPTPTDGKFGGAYTYDGAVYLLLDEAYFNAAFGAKTFEAWVKADTTAGVRTIYEEGGSTNGFALRVNGGVLEFATRDGSTQTTISITYTDTDWHYVAAVFNASNMTLYVDGQTADTTIATYASISGHSDLGGLGGSYNSNAFGSTSTDNFIGTIDEVRITDEALAPATIAAAFALNDAAYTLNLTVSDAFNTTAYAAVSITKNADSPQVVQISPADDYLNTTTNWVLFNFSCNATDTSSLSNISLYLTNASNESFTLRNTTAVGGVQASMSWPVNLTEGIYTWNCKAMDGDGNSGWGENRSINITDLRDLTSPTINNALPQDASYNVTQTITLQANATDNVNISTVYANVTLPNTTVQRVDLSQYLDTSIYNASYWIPVLKGTYNVTYYVNDTSGNSNTTTGNFTASYGGLMAIGETQDPTENDVPFYYYANYTYTDGTPIQGASCQMQLLNHTLLGYFFVPAEAVTDINGTTTYAAVEFEYVSNNTYHTDYLLSLHLAYTGALSNDMDVWVAKDKDAWTSVDPVTAVINVTTHPALNQSIQEMQVTISDSTFDEYGNYTVIFGCSACDASNYFTIGADVDNFGHSYRTGAVGADWSDMESFTYEHLVGFAIGSKQLNLTYNATGQRYEAPETLYLTKNTTYTYTWEANCSKAEHTGYSQQTTITIAINYRPYPNITSILQNPAELGDAVQITWDNDYTSLAFGFYDSYVNITYENGTFIKQYAGSPFTIPASDLPTIGTYNLTAYALNSQGYGTANASLTVQDTTAPSVTGITPDNVSYYPQMLAITANVTDHSVIDTVLANITWSGISQLLELSDPDLDGAYEENFTATAITNYTITIIANDTEGNVNATQSATFSIIGNVIGTENDIATNGNVTIYLNATRINASAYYEGTYTMIVYVNATLVASFTHDFAMPLDLSTISAHLYADAVSFAKAGQENVTLYVPLQGISCHLTICDGVLNESSCNQTNTRYQTVTVQDPYCPVLVNGTYAKDDPDRTDFNVTEAGITFTPSAPTEGVNTTINVTVRNIGETWADNVTVLIIDESTATLLANHTLANFTAGQNLTLTTWEVMSTGPHRITIQIDPDDDYLELNETNNNASTWLNVSAWQTLYGTLNRTLSLADSNNYSLFTWPTDEPGGYLYAADIDAAIEWDSIQALGRTSGGQPAPDDFADADAVLGLTGYADTITARFTSDGQTPLSTINRTLQGMAVNNIPVANSTNTSSFTTGILWDTSNDVNGEYDQADAEDLIFFTQISQDTAGKYGTYDYELTFPSALQDTKGAAAQTYLYIEIT